MSLTPYASFKEWEKDMDRIRAHPQDSHLIQHVKGRISASSPEIQLQVTEYLQAVQFENDVIASGRSLACITNKVLFIRDLRDPWFTV